MNNLLSVLRYAKLAAQDAHSFLPNNMAYLVEKAEGKRRKEKQEN